MSTPVRTDLPMLHLQFRTPGLTKDVELYKDGTLARYFRSGPFREVPLQLLAVPEERSALVGREVVYLSKNQLLTVVSYLGSKGLFSSTLLVPGNGEMAVSVTLVLNARMMGQDVTRVIVGDTQAKVCFLNRVNNILLDEFPTRLAA